MAQKNQNNQDAAGFSFAAPPTPQPAQYQPQPIGEQVAGSPLYGNGTLEVPPPFLQQNARLTQAGGRRLPCKGHDPSKPVSAVIVTVFDGPSYDDLYREVQQECPDPTKSISLFQLSYDDLQSMLNALRGGEVSTSLVIREIVREMDMVDRDSVVFNFECCGACSSSSMPLPAVTMSLVKLLLDRGHLLMFGDFSVKALITFWDENLLGPNPFIKVGEFGSQFKLGFDPERLAACPVSQLQRVAELCTSGTAVVHAMGGTISFTVDPSKADTDAYDVRVLSVCTEQSGFFGSTSTSNPSVPMCRAGEHEGMAGHIAVVYPTGGQIIASCGHWIELSRLDVNITSVLQAAEKQYGEAYSRSFAAEYRTSAPAMQDQMMQDFSKQYVQSAAPCKYSGM